MAPAAIMPFMTAPRSLLVLGCGTSVGVPMIGCECAVCQSTNPRNNRTRSSILLELPGGRLLVDTTPELRIQFLRERVPYADAVLYTHYHADHLFGLDDARLFPRRLRAAVPLYCTEDVEAVVRNTFGYAFADFNKELPAGVVPKLEFRRITPGVPFTALGQAILPIPLTHGRFHSLGFRFDSVAYCTDVSRIPDDSWALLEDLDVLILDALKPGSPNPAHMGLDEALLTIERLRPKMVFLTHMGHEMEYDELCETLPANVRPAYDGLRIEF